MIRHAEAVLDGHPDKFCDQVADHIIQEAYTYDPEAYGQVEVACWSDRVWLSGAVVTRKPFGSDLRDLVREVGREVGYAHGNWVDADRYELDDHVCRIDGDPREWTRHVNDQCIVIGWAGYDEKTRYLPPEQFLVHALREALCTSCRSGLLRGEGPDGKLLVVLREEGACWRLEQVLVTLQQRERTDFLDLCTRVASVVKAAYRNLRRSDPRWVRGWDEVELLVNPNGPLLNGGSDGDNGQTGRKLVMDYYGPRVPLGGGALSGKDLSHIDRAAALSARQAAVGLVARGAGTCKITLCYAPNRPEPLDLALELDRPVDHRPKPEDFRHERLLRFKSETANLRQLGRGTHFYRSGATWNQPAQPVI